ncbi:MAG: MFS transporter [Actinomycetota bacterium]|nr:MFS transporter [Actinomycetota bacterium]
MRGRSYLRSLNPQLSRDIWLLQLGGLTNAFGNGIVLPFLIIYLHNVRGIPLGLAGLAAAVNSLAGLASGFVAGSFADRLGPRRVLVASLIVMAVATSLFPLIETVWHAYALNLLLGAASGAFWPSQSAMLTGLAPPAQRHSGFAVQRMSMNLGIALGGVVGGAIAQAEHPRTFTVLFLLDAVTFAAYAVVAALLPSPRYEGEESGTYREVVHDRPFMGYVALNALFISAGMVVIVELLAPYAKNEAGVDEQMIGLLWTINAIVVVVAQLPVAKLAEGRRRMRGLALMGVLWAAALLGIGAAGTWFEATPAFALMAVAIIVFATGECLHGIVHGPLTADLAPPALVGRYMAFGSQSWQAGWVVGPAIGGFALQHSPNALWVGAAALNLIGAACALGLERALPREVRRAPRGSPAG